MSGICTADQNYITSSIHNHVQSSVAIHYCLSTYPIGSRHYITLLHGGNSKDQAHYSDYPVDGQNSMYTGSAETRVCLHSLHSVIFLFWTSHCLYVATAIAC